MAMSEHVLRARWHVIVLLLLCTTGGSGCAHRIPPTAAQWERGYVVLLPGIEGNGWQFDGLIRGLRDAGVDRAIEVVPWGSRAGQSMENLTNLPKNLERAQRIAAKIEAYQEKHPDRPITLVGYSGGGGLACLAVDALSDDVAMDRLVLCAAAISPRYDLSRALSICRGGVVNFYSSLDWLMVGIGTKSFGTIDRQKVESAGFAGFQDEDGELVRLDGLMQIRYDPDWIWLGHTGGHAGSLSRAWAREVLAGYIDPSVAQKERK